MRVLIVDDEPLAQEIMEAYVARVPGFTLAGICNNAIEAFAMVSRQQADLMLLDINMPEISGIDFLRSLKQPPSPYLPLPTPILPCWATSWMLWITC